MIAVLASCSSSVYVSVPTPTSSQVSSTCATLKQNLPNAIMGKPLRITDPQSELTAAWGSPAITLRCGVGTAVGLAPDSELITVNGVDWFPEQHTGGYLFTTVGRTANIEVSVPSSYAPETSALADISTTIGKSDPLLPK